MQHTSEPFVPGETDIFQCLIKTSDRTLVHLLVGPVAAVHANDRRLVAVSLRERRRTTERLGPVGRQSLGVLRMEAVAEGVAHHLVGQHPLVPGVREPEQTRVAAGRCEDRQMRPCSIASSTQGTTMSSISSRDVVASKPRTSRALRTSGTRRWTSCSNGGSVT